MQQQRFLTKEQLQFLVDRVAEAVGEKHKYVANINARRHYGAVAHTGAWVRGDTNRRVIEFSRNSTYGWFETEADKTQPQDQNIAYHQAKRTQLIKDTVHEIAHFKTEQLYRTRRRREWIQRHRYHTKRFNRICNALLRKLEPHLQNLLSLELPTTQPKLPKPKPTKQEIQQKKLLKTQLKIKRLTTRIKRLQTILKKEHRREKYYRKQLIFG